MSPSQLTETYSIELYTQKKLEHLHLHPKVRAQVPDHNIQNKPKFPSLEKITDRKIPKKKKKVGNRL